MNICKPDTDFVQIWLINKYFSFFPLTPHPPIYMYAHIFFNNNIVPVASL